MSNKKSHLSEEDKGLEENLKRFGGSEELENEYVEDSSLKIKQDSDQKEAEAEQEELIEQIAEQVGIESEAEVKENQETEKSSKFMKISLGVSGATLVIVLGMALFGGSENAKQDTLNRVGNLLKKHNESVMAAQQAQEDGIKSLNAQITELKQGQLKLNGDMLQLEKNQQQMVDRISSIQAPDMTKVEKSLDEIKTTISAQGAAADKLINANESGKVALKQPDVNDIEMSYVGVSPNGAILKISDHGKTKYLTVQPMDNTPYGKVTYVTNDKVKIGDQEISYGSNNPTVIKVEAQ